MWSTEAQNSKQKVREEERGGEESTLTLVALLPQAPTHHTNSSISTSAVQCSPFTRAAPQRIQFNSQTNSNLNRPNRTEPSRLAERIQCAALRCAGSALRATISLLVRSPSPTSSATRHHTTFQHRMLCSLSSVLPKISSSPPQ